MGAVQSSVSNSPPGSWSLSAATLVPSEQNELPSSSTNEWDRLSTIEIDINNSLDSLSQVDYRNLTTDSFQQVRSTLENLINVLMPEGADSLAPFDADQEKLFSHIQSYFEHSPTLDSARMVEYWINVTVGLSSNQADQRKTNFHDLIQIMSAEGKPKTHAMINSLVESYSYALSHIHGVKDDTDQKEMLEYIHHALKEEDSLTAQTKVRTLGHLVASFSRIKASDNKHQLQQIVEKLFGQIEAGLSLEDKYQIMYEFICAMHRNRIPVHWALDKADILCRKVGIFPQDEIIAKKVGAAMLELARYIFQIPELSDHIRTDALNLLEQLATQPILSRDKKSIQSVYGIAKEKAYIQPFRERFREVYAKIKLFDQAPDTLV